ncbi:Urea ABC transporter, ATP-binding protein UrtD [Candidatus Nitrospira nitrosa]|uniref:Urea ABC transporter, ATP-binding protein UrtD n=1 Tax=Candidatus Nitrospira nitrosa TaxID=1742972 RepID=A0A0S4LD84_9BACT|nr:urea ABC transporter ATP-binding protein UrtD [Candidatus Nitrospira nitrosa]CUS35575.1 Urea ABC transporter, ATP-binding protein UrtD [Candidatus Nitrospira nitrosa]
MTDDNLILNCQNVVMDYDGFKALNNCNFSVHYNELRVVIGPNGAGKTTLLDVICGKTKPTSGKVLFGNGINLVGKNAEDITKLGVGRKFQAPSIYANLSVWQNLDLSVKRASKGVFPTLMGRSTPAERERIDETLETIGLMEHAHDRAGSLSHGQKQWLEIGMVILQDPSLLLVDEPVAGMSDKETEQTGQLLTKLSGKQAIVVIEHDMDFVRQIANIVTVLAEGTVVCEGTVETVQADEHVRAIYLGRAKVAH